MSWSEKIKTTDEERIKRESDLKTYVWLQTGTPMMSGAGVYALHKIAEANALDLDRLTKEIRENVPMPLPFDEMYIDLARIILGMAYYEQGGLELKRK